MTISKKMLLIVTLGFGMQFGASAYDAVGLKQEVTAINNFVQTLRKMTTSTAGKIVTWLEEKISNESTTKVNDLYLCMWLHGASDTEILEIARIVENNGITVDAKIAGLLEIITKETNKAAEELKAEAKNKIEREKQQKKAKARTRTQQKMTAASLGILIFVGMPMLRTVVNLTDDFLYPAVKSLIGSAITKKA